jgi:hypothetical protein
MGNVSCVEDDEEQKKEKKKEKNGRGIGLKHLRVAGRLGVIHPWKNSVRLMGLMRSDSQSVHDWSRSII